MQKKTILITGTRTEFTNEIRVDGRLLSPHRSQALRNHSPDGFNWGYGGSGPAQTALAICLHVLKNRYLAVELYQHFKWEIVARWPFNSSFTITVDMDAFLTTHAREVGWAKDKEHLGARP